MRTYLVSFLLSQGDRFYHHLTVGIEMVANDLKDLFNLIVGGNLNLKDLGIPSDIIKEIKKSLRYYKAYIPHVSKNEINKYNFPRKINLNF